MAIWKLGIRGDVMVIDGKIGSAKILYEFLNIITLHQQKQLIVVANNSDDFERNLDFTVFTDNFNLYQLNTDSQLRVLESEVMFQGFPICLKVLADESTLKTSINANILFKLLNEDHRLEIGKKLDDLDPCYIPRTFIRKEFVNENIFKEKKYLPCFISSCHFFLIEDATDFQELQEHCENIHWIQVCDESYLWRSSKGDILPVMKHLKHDSSSCQFTTTEDIIELPHQVVLVVAQPGMGKSTEISHIAHEIKKTDEAMWIVKVDLNEYTHFLSQNQVNGKELLFIAGNFNTKFQRYLFEYQINVGGKVTLLFDGFDEISPTYSETVFSLLNEFSNTKIKNIFVTSRPVMREQLVQRLSILPISFKPFTENDQKNFLIKYWRMCKGSYDLIKFISALLRLIGTSLNAKLKDFTGIPLQTRMLAEVFQNEALHFCDSGEIIIPSK
ncbi:hypothetical protein L9F63_019446 [Diploptera punctata]|uniref:NACHT domain-containing protein n=1 Tax=Diploptera punctata TaxID=6984 RepID=A0AAD7ZU55_DIPPU|nr:hypothetical protein L9F63_019446 [Diploptera punctata]